MRFAELVERLGDTRRGAIYRQVTKLREAGALQRRVLPAMPFAVENHLTGSGLAMLQLADLLEAWLADAPEGQPRLGDDSARAVIRALVGGWESGVLQAIASQPRSVVEISERIAELSYPALNRRLSALRSAGLAEALNRAGSGTSHIATLWAQQAATTLQGSAVAS